MRTLIIHAGATGYDSDAVFQFQRYLLEAGDECLLRQLGETWDDAEALACAEDFDLVVLSGGDYEVSRLLAALAGRDLSICVFPSGPVNLFFASLGCAAEPFALAHACREGRTVAADLGEISWIGADGRRERSSFSLMAGTGFDAELMRAGASNRRAMGQMAYFMAALSNPQPPVVRFTIELDGKTIERDGIACLVANTAMIQGDIEIVPDCRLDDGLLDVIVLETPDAVGLLKPVLFGFLDPSGKNLGRPQIEGFQGRHVRVRASERVPMQVDGEPLEDEVLGFEARIMPSAVNLIVDTLSPYFSGTEAESEADRASLLRHP